MTRTLAKTGGVMTPCPWLLLHRAEKPERKWLAWDLVTYSLADKLQQTLRQTSRCPVLAAGACSTILHFVWVG